MTLQATWIEANKKVLASQVQAILNESWKKQTYECIECKEKLSPVKDCVKTSSEGNEFYVISHFSHKPESTCKLALNESQEHIQKKDQIISALFTGRIKINVNATIITLNPNEIKGTEQTVLDNRADILIAFNQFNPLLGLGLAIEVMESESFKSIEDKRIKWTSKGYTVISVSHNKKITDLIKEGLNCRSPFLTALNKQVMENIKELKTILERASVLPNLQQHSISQDSNNCLTCCYGGKDKTLDGIINNDKACCWLWYNKGLQKRPDKWSSDHICNFYNGVRK